MKKIPLKGRNWVTDPTQVGRDKLSLKSRAPSVPFLVSFFDEPPMPPCHAASCSKRQQSYDR